MDTELKQLEAQKREIEAQILTLKIKERESKPKPRFIDGMGVIEQGFYGRNYMTEIIAGSGREEDKYYGLQLMRGCKHCMKYKYAWGNSNSWGGYAVAVTRRYLRRYYPKTIFYNRDIWEVIKPILARFPLDSRTLKSCEESLNIYPIHEDTGKIIFKGKTRYLGKERYAAFIALKSVNSKLTQIEAKYNEAKAN